MNLEQIKLNWIEYIKTLLCHNKIIQIILTNWLAQPSYDVILKTDTPRITYYVTRKGTVTFRHNIVISSLNWDQMVDTAEITVYLMNS